MNRLHKKVHALPNAKKIPERWHHMKAEKDKQHGKSEWKQNPLKLITQPVAIDVFRQLDKKLRHRMLRKLSASVKFNPKKLVTYQPCVSAAGIITFLDKPRLMKKQTAYVLGTEKGPCIWNGNHRAAACLLAGMDFECLYLDLVGTPKKR